MTQGFLAALLCGAAAVVAHAGDNANLLVNGDFHEGGGVYTPGWVFSRWNLKAGTPEAAAARWGIVNATGHEANKCLWLALTNRAKAYIWFQQEVPCDPAEAYTLTFRAKGATRPENKGGSPGCGFYVLNTDGHWLLYQAFQDVSFSPDWTTYTARITTPDDAGKLGVRLGFSGDGVYDMSFDDVTLVSKLTSPPEGEVAPSPSALPFQKAAEGRVRGARGGNSPTPPSPLPSPLQGEGVRPAADEASFGARIARTMTELATSTPEHRNAVRVLFYGQSIIALPWSHAVGNRLKNTYPNADVTVENRAIGGFQADRLVKTAHADLYPDYPDLVIFHDYGGDGGELETIIASIRRLTTAEILLTTHHVSHPGNAWVQSEYDKQSQRIRDLAAKYDCELVDVREEWKSYLAENRLKPQDLLTDVVHLNGKGCKLMEALVWRHLRYDPHFANPHAAWIKTVLEQPGADGSCKLNVFGNRVDLVAGVIDKPLGTARILIDGQPPSSNPKAYAFTRTSLAYGAWWPALYQVGCQRAPLVENWTLKLGEISADAKQFTFTVTGSRTGPDGAGSSAEKFVSKSGRVVIDPADFGVAAAQKQTGKPCPPGFEITWSVMPMFKDIYASKPTTDPSRPVHTTVVQLIENGPHTVEILPNNDGAVPVAAIQVFRPPLP